MFNKSKWKKLNDQSGMVMPMVMMIMVLALCIVAPGLVAAGTTAKVNRELEASTMAYYAAKAGMEDALWKFKTTAIGEIPGLTNLTVNGMTVERSLNTSALGENYHVVTSIARLNGIEKAKIFAEIKVEYIPYTPYAPASTATTGYPFRYAIASTGGWIELLNNMTVHSPNHKADVFAKGGILDASQAWPNSVSGTGYYLQGTTSGSEDAFTGGCLPGDSDTTFQQINEEWYLDQAELGARRPTCSPCLPLSLPLNPPYGTAVTLNNAVLGRNGISYINGDLTITGANTLLTGVVWVNGNITVDGTITTPSDSSEQCYLLAHGTASDPHSITLDTGTRIRANNNLSLIADYGNVTVMNQVYGYGGKDYLALFGIIYAYNGTVYIHNNTTTSAGAILGKNVHLDNNVKLEYDEDFLDNPPDGFKLNEAACSETPETPASTAVTIWNYSGQ